MHCDALAYCGVRAPCFTKRRYRKLGQLRLQSRFAGERSRHCCRYWRWTFALNGIVAGHHGGPGAPWGRLQRCRLHSAERRQPAQIVQSWPQHARTAHA